MNRYWWAMACLFLRSTPVWACKMTVTGSDSAAIYAALQSFTQKEQSREIKAVRKVKSMAWTYVIESTKEGKACQAIAYQVSFNPTCHATVSVLKAKFKCQ